MVSANDVREAAFPVRASRVNGVTLASGVGDDAVWLFPRLVSRTHPGGGCICSRLSEHGIVCVVLDSTHLCLIPEFLMPFGLIRDAGA